MSDQSVAIFSALTLLGSLAFVSAAQAGERTCKPTLGFREVRFAPMQPPTLERKWTAVLSVDASRCATASGRFGIIFSRMKDNAPEADFVEHFTKQELLKLFPLIFRSLRKGGLFLVQTPNGEGLYPGQVIYGDLTHLTIFAQDSLEHILTLAGFRNMNFAETGPVPDTWEGKLRTFLWSIIRGVIRIIRQIEAKNSSRLWTESFICWCEK